MSYWKRPTAMPDYFDHWVIGYGSQADVPTTTGSKRGYHDAWINDWLLERLFNQWRYVHAVATGKKPARTWFYATNILGEEQDPADWKTTVMHVMNAEYAGNASYEWFDWREDVNGHKQMYRVNQFDRIESTKDKRLVNPYLEYIFSRPEIPLLKATREFKKTLLESIEKKN